MNDAAWRLSLPCADLESEWCALRLSVTKSTIEESLATFKPEWFYNRQLRKAFVFFRDAYHDTDKDRGRRRAANIMSGRFLDCRELTAIVNPTTNLVKSVAQRLRDCWAERKLMAGVRDALSHAHTGHPELVADALRDAVHEYDSHV